MSGPRLILDVTTSSRWKGKDVGITRTERKFVEYLLQHPPADLTVCFVVRIGPREWKTLSLDEVHREVARLQQTAIAMETSPEVVDTVPTRASRVVDHSLRIGKQVALTTASRVQDRLPSEARADFIASIRHFGLMSRWVVHSFRHRSLSTSGEEPGASRGWDGISEQDVYVSMGLDWDDKSLFELWELRETFGFSAVVNCYDLIPCLFANWIPSDPFIYDQHFSDLVWTADLVTCISDTVNASFREFAKDSVVEIPDTQTVLLGADFVNMDDTDDPVPALEDERFVLFVSTLEPRKNHRLLIDVWKQLDGDVKLVFAGRVGWKSDDIVSEIATDPSLIGRVIHLENTSDQQLLWLYRNCQFTVFPSRYEGWGLPVVESLLLGRPCVASTAGAVVEAGMGLALHIDVLDGKAWLDTIQRMCDDPEFLEDAVTRIRDAQPQLRERLTWVRFGSSMCALVSDVAERRRGRRIRG